MKKHVSQFEKYYDIHIKKTTSNADEYPQTMLFTFFSIFIIASLILMNHEYLSALPKLCKSLLNFEIPKNNGS